jgi:hypothetical protein
MPVPIIGFGKDGSYDKLMIFLVGQDRQLYYAWQDVETGVISAWVSLGGDWPSVPVIAVFDFMEG